MKPKLLIFLFFISGYCFGAQLPMHLKTHADTTPFEIRKNHLELSKYLASACHTESEKVLVFTYWIAKNIRYDLAESKSIKRNKIAREVLRDRSAVCGGFAALMKQFCDNENILCFKIGGYGRGGFIKNTFLKEKLLHAWNIIYVEKQWKCLDVTWMNDIVKTSEFKKTGKMKWVYMDPKEFAETHLPYDPRWQLLNDPNTEAEFWKVKELTKRKYTSADSMAIIKDKPWYEAEMISIKGAFVENKSEEAFIRDLCILGLKLTGGSYDSTDCVLGKEIFLEAQRQWIKLEPYKNSKDQEAAINTGLWLSDKRIEMGE